MAQESNMKHDWSQYPQEFIGRRGVYPCFSWWLVRMYSDPNMRWKYDVGACQNTKNNIAEWIYLTKPKTFAAYYFNLFTKNKNEIKEVEKYILANRTIAAKKLIAANVARLSDKQLLKLLDIFFEAYYHLMFITGVLRRLDIGLMYALEGLVQDRLDSTSGVVSLLSISNREGFNTKEEKELLQLAIKLKKHELDALSPEAEKDLMSIYQRYCWITCGYYNEKARTLDEYHALLQDRINKNPEKTIQEIEIKASEERFKRDKLIAQLKPTAEERWMIALAQESAFLKDLNKFSSNEIIYRAEPLFAEIAKRIGTTTDQLKHYFVDEMKTALIEKKLLDPQRIAERKHHLVLIAVPDVFEVYEGKDADDFEAKYIKKFEEGKNEFTGRVASKGYAKGVVRVVLGAFDFKKVQQGDILIVSNTTPDYVRIMKKAAAIVAEEGGLTAHVSVVSREFSIPCVVGIPNITKQLKDGDKVEVDANKGVVRKR